MHEDVSIKWSFADRPDRGTPQGISVEVNRSIDADKEPYIGIDISGKFRSLLLTPGEVLRLGNGLAKYAAQLGGKVGDVGTDGHSGGDS